MRERMGSIAFVAAEKIPQPDLAARLQAE